MITKLTTELVAGDVLVPPEGLQHSFRPREVVAYVITEPLPCVVAKVVLTDGRWFFSGIDAAHELKEE